jgi:hypothetical protein
VRERGSVWNTESVGQTNKGGIKRKVVERKRDDWLSDGD